MKWSTDRLAETRYYSYLHESQTGSCPPYPTILDCTWAKEFGQKTRRTGEEISKTTQQTTTGFFYTNHVDGGLGLPCILKEMDVARVTTPTKLLSSKDPTVKQVALHQLQEIATKKQSTTPDSLEDFLNSPLREGKADVGTLELYEVYAEHPSNIPTQHCIYHQMKRPGSNLLILSG